MIVNEKNAHPTGKVSKLPEGRKRVLIEASKLADVRMDGIKRYVVELLVAYSDLNLEEELDLDVMINDRVYRLAEVVSGFDTSDQESSRKQAEDGLAKGIGMLIPPILLYPIKWLIPNWASRRFLGKDKSELQVSAIDMTSHNLLLAILPPFLVSWLQKMVPESFVHFLWGIGLLEPGPKAVDPEPYDLIHFTLPNNHHYIRPTSTPSLVTVHDLCHIACPQYQTQANSVTLKRGLDRAVESGADFVCVSKATQQQLTRQYDLENDRVCTIYNGCSSEHFHPVTNVEQLQKSKQKYGLPQNNYLLALSTIEPRKNLAKTMQAFELLADEFAELDIHLVIAGNQGWKSQKVLRAADSSPHIHLTGYIEDEDLATIYSAALGFVYVSHYEGFGLPLLEAMHCGVPVIYGNNSSMPEIVGETGLAAQSGDVQDIAKQMRQLVSDKDLARTMGEKAMERAAQFSWEAAALQTIDAYRKVLS